MSMSIKIGEKNLSILFLIEFMFSMADTLREKCPYSELFWSGFSAFGPE